MGETRPTSVRGSEMDDVIFSGIGRRGRPATSPRSRSSSTIPIAARPAPYNEYDTIEMSRRIEREAGSVYRINGRDVRQRDVQMFFADASSGAGSTAFVRQGQIGLLISQKPLARRAILEEAAGIGGLHQRRHEAELRLRAAETNLGRLDDVIREVEGQLASLKRQARQASRYRNLSGHIRKAEALAHYLRWTAAELRMRAADEELAAASAARRSVHRTRRRRLDRAGRCRQRAAAAAPDRGGTLRRPASPGRRTRSARCRGSARPRSGAAPAPAHRADRAGHRTRTRARQRCRQRRLQALGRRRRQHSKRAIARSSDELHEAEAHRRRAERGAGRSRTHARTADAELAEWNARKASQERARELASALAETQRRSSSPKRRRASTAPCSAPPTRPTCAPPKTAAERARARAEAARSCGRRSARSCSQTRNAPKRTRAIRWKMPSAKCSGCPPKPRRWAICCVREGQDLFPPLIDAVTVQPGYEAALAAALGDDLQAPLDEASPHHWRDLGAFDAIAPLPAGAKPLGEFRQGAAALARRLAMTGVVFPDQGTALQGQLKPGQRLVSPRGDLWRWDGYVGLGRRAFGRRRASGTAQSPRRARTARSTARAKHAPQRFADLFRRASDAAAAAREAARAAEAGRTQHRTGADRRAGRRRPAPPAPPPSAPRNWLRWKPKSAVSTQSREAARESAPSGRSRARRTGRRRRAERRTSPTRAAATAEARTANSEARAALEGLKREGEARTRRLAAIADEQRALGGAPRRRRHADRRTRTAAAKSWRDELAARRSRSRQRSPTSATACSTRSPPPKPRATQAADARAAGRDACSPKPTRHAKAADAALVRRARGTRPRPGAVAKPPPRASTELRDRIRDELEAAPEELAERAEIKDGEELPPLEQAEKRVEKLKQEREQLGGVNLRAEEEAAEAGSAPARRSSTDRDDLDRRHRAAAPRHPEPQPRRPRTPARLVREGEREFPEAVHQAVRRRRSQADLHRIRRSARSRPRNLRPPARQAAAVAGAALGRRAGADRAWR